MRTADVLGWLGAALVALPVLGLAGALLWYVVKDMHPFVLWCGGGIVVGAGCLVLSAWLTATGPVR